VVESIATVGICPSSDTIENTLNSQETFPNKFENCKVPVNVEKDSY
jgi:hypothetical protein